MKKKRTIIEIVISFVALITIILTFFDVTDDYIPIPVLWNIFTLLFVLVIFFAFDTFFISKEGCKAILHILTLIIIILFINYVVNSCNADKMAANYDKHEAGLNDLIEYTQSAINDGCHIWVEYEYNKISIFGIQTNQEEWNCYWDEEARESAPELMQQIGLSEQELSTIKEKLRKVNCMSIETNSEYTFVGYKRAGIRMFSYIIFPQSLTDDEISEYDNDDSSIFYRDNVLFNSGGDLIGSDTFPGKKDFMKRNRQSSMH